MGLYFKIHPDNPQGRLIKHAVEIIQGGGVIACPTDTAYALVCHLGDKSALDRIIQIRQLDHRHHFTLVCRDLSEISTYARFDTPAYRILKSHTPGPYTFILRATKEVPRRLMHPKQKTIGIRVPNNPITLALLEDLNEPMMTTTLILPEEAYPMHDPQEIRSQIDHKIDLIIDGGHCGLDVTTMVDLRENNPQVLRKGKGDPSDFNST